MIEAIKNIDTQLFLWLNGKHNDFFDVLMDWVSAKITWVPFYIFLLFLVYYKFKKSTWLVLISVALLITLSDQISVHFFKNVFERYRPCHNEAIAPLVHVVDGCGGKFGFVSSHASNTFALAAFLGLIIRGRYFVLGMLSWALFVSYSRIYNGVHYPADIIGGALLGIMLAGVVAKLFFYAHRKILKENENPYK